MCVPCFGTLVWVICTGWRLLPIPWTLVILSLHGSIQGRYLLKLSLERDRTSHIFSYFVLSAGPKSLLCMVSRSLVVRSWTLEWWSVVSWGLWELSGAGHRLSLSLCVT